MGLVGFQHEILDAVQVGDDRRHPDVLILGVDKVLEVVKVLPEYAVDAHVDGFALFRGGVGAELGHAHEVGVVLGSEQIPPVCL